MEELNWGIIGCGDVTEIKSGPAFNKIEGSNLIAVMRRNEIKVKDYAKRHKVPKWYINADDLIHDPDVHAIYIATPPSSHKNYAISAMEAGKPVYVEKPMALNFNECIEMVKTSDRTGIPLYVAYYRRMLPGYLKIKELIYEGAIGDVRMVNIRMYSPPKQGDLNEMVPWRVIPEISGGGHFFDLASHQLDYLDYLFGPVVNVSGFAANQAHYYQAEDVVTGSLVFESGVACSGSWCFTTSADAEKDIIEIVGSKGIITFSTFNFIPIVLETKAKRHEFINERPAHVQQPLIQTIVDEQNGKGKCPSTGETAARTSWVMDEIVKNYYAEDYCR